MAMIINKSLVIIALIFAFNTSALPFFANAWQSQSSSTSTTIAFTLLPYSRRSRHDVIQSAVRSHSPSSQQMQMQGFSQEVDRQLNVTIISKTGKNGNEYEMRRVVIQQIALDNTDELERMSRFCIDAFYGDGDEDRKNDSLLSRKWKEIRLGAMQKAQLLDISLSTVDNRCIFVAKDVTTADNSHEIIGCCEVIEEKLDILMAARTQPMSSSTTARSSSERERRKTARPRPIIENLCVKGEYRRSGVGIALLHACEEAVHQLWVGQDQIFAQVLEDNHRAYGLFVDRCGYQFLFEDPTCTEVVLDDTLFAKEVVVTKRMLRKFL